MIELLISACTLSTQLSQALPECREFSLLYDAREVTVMTCMVHGQPQVALWKEAPPAWNVERWQCRTRDVRESGV